MSERELALPFEEELDTRGARRRRLQKKKRDRRRAVTAMILVLTIFVLLAGGVWYGIGKVRSLMAAPDYAGSGTGRVVVQIKEGDSATAVAATLVQKGVVKSRKAFVEAATADPRSLGLQPGSYQLRKEMKASEALTLLLDPKTRVTMSFRLREGLSSMQAFAEIEKATSIKAADLAAAAKQPAALGVPAWGHQNIEGFLFPATYDLPPDADATTVLKAMVARSVQELDSLDFVAKAQAVNLEPYEALKVASLVEGEGRPENFGKVARVVYNRQNSGMPLQFDSSTLYGRELRGLPRRPTKAGELYSDLRDPSDPYSTYVNKDLPPTPIANPGTAALEAAVAPDPGPWLYFVVVSSDGQMAFTDSLAVHEANIAKCRAAGKCN
ncbi:MAG: putative aminodeoxychorismate lyase [Mycobacterium sp.]|nr:putative aminodeoxychorismate lyase [Mycobacterium sp.]